MTSKKSLNKMKFQGAMSPTFSVPYLGKRYGRSGTCSEKYSSKNRSYSSCSIAGQLEDKCTQIQTVKVRFALEQALKAQRGDKITGVLFI